MRFCLYLIALTAVSCAAAPPATAPLALREPVPPAMPKRPVVKPKVEPPGKRIDIVDGDCKTLLFVPEGYVPPKEGGARVTVHFHTIAWYIIDEHLRRGMKEPLLVVDLGQGSSTYGKPFTDVDRFGRLIGLVEKAISVRVTQVDITSFSAGYGAVREILKQDRYIAMIRRVILADSLYAGWEPGKSGPASRPAEVNMEPFAKFIELAARGEKTFVLTHSQVPTSYANTAATAQWIIDHVGAKKVAVERGSLPATLDPDFPLIARADKGKLHVWSYAGTDLHAHLTHVRHIADIWMALDEAE